MALGYGRANFVTKDKETIFWDYALVGMADVIANWHYKYYHELESHPVVKDRVNNQRKYGDGDLKLDELKKPKVCAHCGRTIPAGETVLLYDPKSGLKNRVYYCSNCMAIEKALKELAKTLIMIVECLPANMIETED